MNNLNAFELSILESCSNEYPQVKEHIPFLTVTDRERTGVGMYINFSYLSHAEQLPRIASNYESIGSREIIEMEGLKHGLNFEIATEDGLLLFIEIVTNGEQWDGNIRKYRFVEI